MKHLILVAAISSFSLGATAGSASAHRNGCHPNYTCPSDHATYKWRGMYCVKPSSDKRTSAFTKRVRYAGLPYLCKG